MRTITNAQLIAANRAALADGTLAALAPIPRCEYFFLDGGQIFHCAIGCVLTGDELYAIPPHELTLDITIANIPVTFEDTDFALQLQRRHDEWCRSSIDDDESYKEYLALIFKGLTR